MRVLTRQERQLRGPRRARWAAAAVLVVTSAATGVTATPAAAVGSSGTHLALGDSVAFGYRPVVVTPPAAYGDPRNFVSYADHTARATGLRLVNASCPGETSGSLISATAPDFGCQVHRSLFPLHVSYSGTQLAYATRYLRTNRQTRLVTVTVGANDVLRCLITPACTVESAVARAAANLAVLLERLRTQGHYRGTIVTLTYYSHPQAPPALVSALNAALAAASRSQGAAVADGLAAFQAAAGSSDACQARLLIALPVGCDIHPTRAGHLVLAVPVTKAYLRSRPAPGRAPDSRRAA